MRTWARAAWERHCGFNPDHTIYFGQPYQIIAVPGVSGTRIRCRSCADEPVPDGISEPERNRGGAIKATGAPALPFHSVADVLADWKRKQAGE